MELGNLKDYQFVLLVIAVLLILLLLTLILLYGIKRKYDSIDKHINKDAPKAYKHCIDEYYTSRDNLHADLWPSKGEKIVKTLRTLFKR